MPKGIFLWDSVRYFSNELVQNFPCLLTNCITDFKSWKQESDYVAMNCCTFRPLCSMCHPQAFSSNLKGRYPVLLPQTVHALHTHTCWWKGRMENSWTQSPSRPKKENRHSETDTVDQTETSPVSKSIHWTLAQDLVIHFINRKTHLESTDLFIFQAVGLPGLSLSIPSLPPLLLWPLISFHRIQGIWSISYGISLITCFMIIIPFMCTLITVLKAFIECS